MSNPPEKEPSPPADAASVEQAPAIGVREPFAPALERSSLAPTEHVDHEGLSKPIAEYLVALDSGAIEEAADRLKSLVHVVGEPEHSLLEAELHAVTGASRELLRCAERAQSASPSDPEVLLTLARARFLRCDLAGAATALDMVREARSEDPRFMTLQAQLLEHRGDFVQADAVFESVARMMGESPPARLSREAFDEAVLRAVERLPGELREYFDEVPLVVDPLPDVAALCAGGDFDCSPEILGLFTGGTLAEQAPGSMACNEPPAIFLYQRNLEALSEDHDELEREIAITVYHEFGHYFGFDEDGLESLGLG